VIAHDDAEWLQRDWESELKLVAGLDISFPTDGGSSSSGGGAGAGQGSSTTRAVAALAALSYPELELRHSELLEVDVEVPYVPGFLGFRWELAVAAVVVAADGDTWV
jgi:deoxyinosine 3'endonuclease (endonuclease V)